MMSNKLHYKFRSENILFVTRENFDYLNNSSKTLDVFGFCYLWKKCIKMNGIQRGLHKMVYESKWKSFERYFGPIVLAWMITYNLAYFMLVQVDHYFYYLNVFIQISDIVLLCP